MGERTGYTPGTFCWADLSTTDQDKAKAFYSALFGWTSQDLPMGDDGAVYSMQLLNGKLVAAISPQQEQQREAGVPPLWNSYISVENADASASRAQELGGTVHAGPFDVFEAGRMAVIQDPGGAIFSVWQAKQHFGAGLVNAHGALSWDELYASDIEASARFYGDLFGWKSAPMEGMDMPYWVITRADGGTNGGITTMEGVPPSWLVYFGTDDIDASVAKVSESGGEVRMGPMSIGVGSIAVVTDPLGGTFALYAGHFED